VKEVNFQSIKDTVLNTFPAAFVMFVEAEFVFWPLCGFYSGCCYQASQSSAATFLSDQHVMQPKPSQTSDEGYMFV